MNTRINIREIKNENLRQAAQEIDTSGISKKDAFLDEKEFSIFAQKVKEQQEKYSQSDFEQVIGLYKSTSSQKTQRAELSWGEIGKIGLKSAKNFVKGMFCDENGFSLKRTLTTAGTIAAFAAVSAIPIVGPAIALIGGAALGTYTALKGIGKMFDGRKEYYKAKTHDEAAKAMEKAMDGGVETGVSLLALLGIRKCASNMSAKAKSGRTTQHNQQAQSQSSQQTQAQNTQSTTVKDTKTNKLTNEQQNNTVETKVDAQGRITQKVTKYKDGHTVEKFYNKSGNVTKEIRSDVNGKKMTTEYKYDKDGFDVISVNKTYEPGYIYQTKPLKTYSEGMLKETTFDKGLRKEVCTDGNNLKTSWYDRKGELVKQELSTQNQYGIVKFEKTGHGYKNTYADGRIVENVYHGNSCDVITTYPNGTKEVKLNVMTLEI